MRPATCPGGHASATSPSPPCIGAIAARLREAIAARRGEAATLTELIHARATRLGSVALLAVGLAVTLVPLAHAGAGRDSTGTIVGWVRDSLTGRPLPFADVLVLGARMGSLADSSGWFVIRTAPCGPWTLKALAIGYRPAQRTVVVKAASTDTMRFALGPIPVDQWFIDTIPTRRLDPPPHPGRP